MLMRLLLLVFAVCMTLHGVLAQRECLGDGGSCNADVITCPKVCCSGIPARTTSGITHCPVANAALRSEPSNNNISNTTSGFAMPSPGYSSPMNDNPPSPIEGGTTPTPSANVNNVTTAPPQPVAPPTTAPVATPTPTPSPSSGTSVDAFQSSQGIGGASRGGSSSSTFMLGGLVAAGCVVVVAAVFVKRKTTKTQTLEIPGSSYHGASGAGLTPDNRSLDGMMDASNRVSTDSMKQLPVLSISGRGGSSIARLSSPFGQNTARISSPAQRGHTNEDYAFDVEIGSRAGSSVQVAFVDATHNDTQADLTEDKPGNGVVAL